MKTSHALLLVAVVGIAAFLISNHSPVGVPPRLLPLRPKTFAPPRLGGVPRMIAVLPSPSASCQVCFEERLFWSWPVGDG